MPERDFPYEATFLSSFGLALGMAIGQHQVIASYPPEPRSRPDTANLVERLTGQMPEEDQTQTVGVNAYSGTTNDFSYGDALVSFRNRGFIAEFKRDLDGWTTEINPDKKQHKIRVLERVCSMEYDLETRTWGDGAGAFDRELYDRSQAAHWFVYGQKASPETELVVVDPLDLCFAPYVCLTRGRAGIVRAAVGLNDFLCDTIRGHFGVSLDILAGYLQVVRGAAEDNSSDGRTANGAYPNGILVYFDRTGRARLIWFRSISQLIQKIEILNRSVPSYAPPVPPTRDNEIQIAKQWEHPTPESDLPKGLKR